MKENKKKKGVHKDRLLEDTPELSGNVNKWAQDSMAKIVTHPALGLSHAREDVQTSTDS